MLNRDASSEYFNIPQSTLDSLQRYVEDGVPTGGFLRAVLANDLMEACGRADEYNRAVLFTICVYIYNETPGNCHGSYDNYDLWLAAKTTERSGSHE